MSVSVKICGLRSPEDVLAAAGAGARYIGFNFFEKSPRYVAPSVARELALLTPEGVAKVGLVVNATDGFLDELTKTVPLDILQLHGSESPERVKEIKVRYGLPVIKAIGVADGGRFRRRFAAVSPIAEFDDCKSLTAQIDCEPMIANIDCKNWLRKLFAQIDCKN